MSKFEEKHVEKLDVESLIVDLLACGLGAIIVLFFIFSVNMISSPTMQVKKRVKEKSDVDGTGMVSLLGDDSPDKPNRMGSIRIVEFSGLEQPAINELKKIWRNNKDSLFWDYHTGEWRKDSLIKSVETQLLVKDNSVAFVFIADAMRKLTFRTPSSDQLNSFSVGKKFICRIYFVEGKSVKYQFNGLMTWPGERGHEMESLYDRRIQILVGKASSKSIGKLVKIIK
jgi:hypothetical protein